MYSLNTNLIQFGIIEYVDGQLVQVVDTGGEINEIASLEFYSGLLIVGKISELDFKKLVEKSASFYELFKQVNHEINCVYLVTGLDYKNKRIKQNSRIKRII